MMGRFKNEGFFGSRSWKNKKLEMQKATKKVQKKKKKSKTLVPRRKEKMEQEKTCVQKRERRDNKLKKGKEKGR